MSGLQQQQQKVLMNLSVSTNGNHAQKEVVGRKKGSRRKEGRKADDYMLNCI
jgi:hypothetical protein